MADAIRPFISQCTKQFRAVRVQLLAAHRCARSVGMSEECPTNRMAA
ncbi:hypothetical protein DIQ79_06390 [Mycolicibacterium smegmatis]|uniref:Uncharacterized protein n=1 Tax=Mycolicibacterium smegmatis (strain ATCC 700084 / mc(2)155) TaxID=246196 RepID=A0R122_MYCS2|nr:hypothetical protein MSMEG_4591 [Mycolicibacterium smegmatis MC2 155]TBM52423.1 hypothetical protein DIQ86_03470 [Mycolicibacterium smegmatis]TBH50721.1 hypothetical protein EYS45_04910 [Mycolicibacterium smegmatis MC2 155]TBM54279.1 hypothetical protein DIQ85_06370 [Mycolicibacterium smegmatis]TBM65805.1 hypothetical protein DIQ83_06390 [Mycolicibacterium smegmatis]